MLSKNSSFISLSDLDILHLDSFFGDNTENNINYYKTFIKMKKKYLPSPFSKIIGFLSTSSSITSFLIFISSLHGFAVINKNQWNIFFIKLNINISINNKNLLLSLVIQQEHY